MQGGQAERSETEDAARADQAGRREDAPRRADEEGQPEQPQRPVAAEPDRLVDRPYPEAAVIGKTGKPDGRRHRDGERHRLFRGKGRPRRAHARW